MTSRQRRILDYTLTLVLTGLVLWAFFSFFQGEAVFTLFANDTDKFRDYLIGLGGWAAFTFVCLVILEVLVAFIPGWFVYPVGAAIFGFFNSVLLILLGNFIAAGISFWIGRRFGKPLLERFISKDQIAKFDGYIERNGTWAVFFLKVNPITSFDIWNYVAGATNIKFWRFMIANTLGILPLIIFSSALGDQGYEVAPQIFGILGVLTVLYIVWYFINLPHKISDFRNKRAEKNKENV